MKNGYIHNVFIIMIHGLYNNEGIQELLTLLGKFKPSLKIASKDITRFCFVLKHFETLQFNSRKDCKIYVAMLKTQRNI